MESDQFLQIVGMIVVATSLVVAGVAALLIVISIVSRYFPRLHCGRPPNRGELTFSRAGVSFLTADGIRKMETHVFRRLHIKWWIGLSHRPSPKWFLGIIRWEESPDA